MRGSRRGGAWGARGTGRGGILLGLVGEGGSVDRPAHSLPVRILCIDPLFRRGEMEESRLRLTACHAFAQSVYDGVDVYIHGAVDGEGGFVGHVCCSNSQFVQE